MCSLILQSEPTEYVPLANAPSSPLLYDMQSTSRQSPPSKTAKYSQETKQLKVGDYKINKRRTPLLYLRHKIAKNSGKMVFREVIFSSIAEFGSEVKNS